MKNWIWLMILFVFLATGCQPDEATPTADAVEPTLPSGISPLTSPLSPLPIPGTLPAGAGSMADAVRVLVAKELKISADSLELVSAEEVMWGDASLGCPEPDKVYAQVVVPGWRMIFEGGGGKLYDVHTSDKPEQYVICRELSTKPGPIDFSLTPIPLPEANDEKSLGDYARQFVSGEKDIPLDELSVVEIEAVDWPNSCLGCAKPDQVCLMVITPGYRIKVQAGDDIYEVHTGTRGLNPIICEK